MVADANAQERCPNTIYYAIKTQEMQYVLATCECDRRIKHEGQPVVMHL